MISSPNLDVILPQIIKNIPDWRVHSTCYSMYNKKDDMVQTPDNHKQIAGS
jgi:hypothetical protein